MTTPLLREETEGDDAPVGTIELFFDLMFVFAVTQLSKELLGELNPLGAVQALVVLAAIWWVWVLTTWAANVLNPKNSIIRILLFLMMGGALFMGTSISEAFEERGWVFALAYVTLQLSRTAFLWWAHPGDEEERNRYARMFAWLALSGAIWMFGSTLPPDVRILVWGLALIVDYAAPIAGFWVPGQGRSATSDLDVQGAHMAERVGLFILIALGESLLIIGQVFSDSDWSPANMGAALAALTGSIGMWWVYFGRHADAAEHVIDTDENPGRIARWAYTYTPLVMVSGIVVTAVGDETVLAHPLHPADLSVQLTVLGGPALFLLGAMIFQRIIFRHTSWARVGGLVALSLAAPFASMTTPLGLALWASAVLLAVSAVEYALNHGRPPRPAPKT